MMLKYIFYIIITAEKMIIQHHFIYITTSRPFFFSLLHSSIFFFLFMYSFTAALYFSTITSKDKWDILSPILGYYKILKKKCLNWIDLISMYIYIFISTTYAYISKIIKRKVHKGVVIVGWFYVLVTIVIIINK